MQPTQPRPQRKRERGREEREAEAKSMCFANSADPHAYLDDDGRTKMRSATTWQTTA